MKSGRLFFDPVAPLSRLLGTGKGALSWSYAQAGRRMLLWLQLAWGRATLHVASPRGFSWLLRALSSQGSQASYLLADALQSTPVDGARPSCPSSDTPACHFYHILVVKVVGSPVNGQVNRLCLLVGQ